MNPDILEEEILSKTTRIIMNKLDEAKICKRIKIGKIPKNQIRLKYVKE